MNVRGIAREQYPSVAICGCLKSAIRPTRGETQSRQGYVGAGDAAQDRLHMVDREWLGSIERATVEINHSDRAGSACQ
jgi:hypothetical protein